jgi:hypothetical protein
MGMAAYQKYQNFVEDLIEGVHDFDAHTFKIALTNATPNAGTHTVLADITELSAGAGYTAGGNATTISTSETGGTAKVTGTDPTAWTGTGTMGPFRYAVLYNDTPTSPADPLIGYWDYGSSITLTTSETFTVDLDGTNGILTVA